MTYSVKEIFYTIQGEGANTGRAAVFCRFAGCNLWSGREEDRSSAICKFCDTDFVGTNGTQGGKYATAELLASSISACWEPNGNENRFVVLTGGEPLLQVDTDLVKALHRHHFFIAIETNGTIAPPAEIDWICVSPKANSKIILTKGNEIKLVYPQKEHNVADFESLQFDFFFLQPKDDAEKLENTRRVIDYCQKNPKWRMAIQTHKLVGVR